MTRLRRLLPLLQARIWDLSETPPAGEGGAAAAAALTFMCVALSADGGVVAVGCSDDKVRPPCRRWACWRVSRAPRENGRDAGVQVRLYGRRGGQLLATLEPEIPELAAEDTDPMKCSKLRGLAISRAGRLASVTSKGTVGSMRRAVRATDVSASAHQTPHAEGRAREEQWEDI